MWISSVARNTSRAVPTFAHARTGKARAGVIMPLVTNDTLMNVTALELCVTMPAAVPTSAALR